MKKPSPRLLLGAFLAASGLALLFALATDHVWEDYYITYRSSKNLAEGNGLVFNLGDKLHTFTSPLGVLLPALASVLTANSSDVGALWIFRLMSAAALGGGVALLAALARRLSYPLVAAGFLVGFVATDAKILDFTINGMETAFMVLFLAYAFWAHCSPGSRQWLHLGAAWGGLMWTRPDSFIYIGLVAVGIWVFNDRAVTGATRRELLVLFVRAGLLTTLIYGPWLLWATWYYGTPIPHTITAKGGQSAGGGMRLWENFWRLPWLIWRGGAAAEGAFLPSYYMFPARPVWMVPFGRALATVASLLWIVPRLRMEARVASLAFFGGVAYLSFVPYFPFPWYFPSTFVLAAVALAGALAQAGDSPRRWLRYATRGLAAATLVGAAALTLGTARQARAQQELIEDGNRRVIGDYLRVHARPTDSVFMEPLGYIGYFSGLKTHDWPGMSSSELVRAKLVVGTHWAPLIRYLQPTWLVLRPDGEGDLPALSRDLHASNYEFVREFNRLPDVLAIEVPGRKLLEFDARFRLYRLKHPMRHDVDGREIASSFGTSLRLIGEAPVRLVHAPGEMILTVPDGQRRVSGQFGFPPEAYAGTNATDGATFRIHWTDGRQRIELFSRELAPASREGDRGLQNYSLELPAATAGTAGRLTLSTDPGRTSGQDWTCWTDPQFSR